MEVEEILKEIEDIDKSLKDLADKLNPNQEAPVEDATEEVKAEDEKDAPEGEEKEPEEGAKEEPKEEVSEEEVDKIEEESRTLIARKKELRAMLDKKEKAEKVAQEIRTKVAEGKIGNKIEKPNMEERKMEFSNKELYLRSVQGTLNAEHRAAIAQSDATPVIPVELQNKIMEKAKEYAPVLNEVELLNVGGYVRYAVEGVSNDAAAHTENGTITPASDSFVEIELNATEVVKMIQISESVKNMALSTFESWLTAHLAEAIAIFIEKDIMAKMLAASTSVATTVTADNVYALFGALKGGYARNARVYCSRKTFYTKLLPLQDKSKNDLVVDGKLLGVTVDTTSSLADDVVILADPTKFVANLGEQIQVRTGYDIDTNSNKFLGVATYDGKVAIAEAFQAIKPASAD